MTKSSHKFDWLENLWVWMHKLESYIALQNNLYIQFYSSFNTLTLTFNLLVVYQIQIYWLLFYMNLKLNFFFFYDFKLDLRIKFWIYEFCDPDLKLKSSPNLSQFCWYVYRLTNACINVMEKSKSKEWPIKEVTIFSLLLVISSDNSCKDKKRETKCLQYAIHICS